MKKNLLFVAILGVAMLAGACTDELTTNPSASVSDQTVFTSTSGAQAALNGCYYQLRCYGSGGADRWDDIGIVSNVMTYEACGTDLVVWNGWYTYDYSFWGHTRGDIFKTYALWNFHYRLINNVNSILAYTEASEGGSDEEKAAIMGQAYALRGWAYFGLIRLFQHSYNIAKNMPGVPIYTTPTNDETEGAPRGTVEQVYAQIVSDLTAAIENLDSYVRLDCTTLDKSVAQGILAEVYLFMEDWDNAQKMAAAARVGYPLMSRDAFQAGFNATTSEWMWELRQTEDQNWYDYSPYAMWGTRTGWNFSCFFLNDKFVELFEEGDVRSQFGFATYHTSTKFVDNADDLGSWVVMRSAEMYLIEAEAYARQGKDSKAKEILNELQRAREVTNLTTSTGAFLVEDILVERRKELYGEGFMWFDLIRNQKPLERSGDHIDLTHLDACSWRFVYQIPESEILNNKSMTSGIWPAGDQNPFDGIYTPQ